LIGKKPLDLSGRNGRKKIQGLEVQWPELSIMENADGRLFVSKGSMVDFERKSKKTRLQCLMKNRKF
jgi:hypothetical protein